MPATTHNRFFFRHVLKPADPNACWIWTGARCGSSAEYGQTRSQGRKRMAHAVAWELVHGPLPLDRRFVLDHTCRNTLCVNPAHLEYVPQRENLARGTGTASRLHTPKSHCPKGHPRDGITNYGSRFCRECARQANRNLVEKKRAQGTLRKAIWRHGKYQGRETFPGSGVGVRESEGS